MVWKVKKRKWQLSNGAKNALAILAAIFIPGLAIVVGTALTAVIGQEIGNSMAGAAGGSAGLIIGAVIGMATAGLTGIAYFKRKKPAPKEPPKQTNQTPPVANPEPSPQPQEATPQPNQTPPVVNPDPSPQPQDAIPQPNQTPPVANPEPSPQPVANPESVESDRGRYVCNTNSLEIHDTQNLQPACNFEAMLESHKVKLDSIAEVEEAIKSQGYNGCRWCLTRYDTG